jgi:hypothetical protein
MADAGAAFAMDWRAMYGLAGLTVRDEQRSCQRIANCINQLWDDEPAQARLTEHLAGQATEVHLERAAVAQTAFLQPYGDEDGPQQVAAYIRHLVSPR